MHNSGLRSLLAGAILALTWASGFQVMAGGSGLNTVVVVNQNSTNSCELGNYYCERRKVPPENVLRIAWPGGNISWGSADFQASLLAPLLDMLASRQLSSQVDYVVLSMDIPFQTVYDTNKVNSTTSALFYGLKDDTGPNWMDVTNSYSASEQIFRQAKPASAPGTSFLTTMLTAGSLAQAKLLVDQGVVSDSTFPGQSPWPRPVTRRAMSVTTSLTMPFSILGSWETACCCVPTRIRPAARRTSWVIRPA